MYLLISVFKYKNFYNIIILKLHFTSVSSDILKTMKIITYEHKSVNEHIGTRMTDVAFD